MMPPTQRPCEAAGCGQPAVWYVEDVGRYGDDYWACEAHAREVLLYTDGTCADAHLDADYELVEVTP